MKLSFIALSLLSSVLALKAFAESDSSVVGANDDEGVSREEKAEGEIKSDAFQGVSDQSVEEEKFDDEAPSIGGKAKGLPSPLTEAKSETGKTLDSAAPSTAPGKNPATTANTLTAPAGLNSPAIAPGAKSNTANPQSNAAKPGAPNTNTVKTQVNSTTAPSRTESGSLSPSVNLKAPKPAPGSQIPPANATPPANSQVTGSPIEAATGTTTQNPVPARPTAPPAAIVPVGQKTIQAPTTNNLKQIPVRRVPPTAAQMALTAAQTDSIALIRKASNPELEKALEAEIKQAKIDVSSMMVDASPAEKIRERFTLMQRKTLELQKLKFERSLKIREILTVEQRKKLNDYKNSH